MTATLDERPAAADLAFDYRGTDPIAVAQSLFNSLS